MNPSDIDVIALLRLILEQYKKLPYEVEDCLISIITEAEADRLTNLVKKDEKTIEWLQEYLKQHLEKIGKTKLRTNKFNVSIRKASIAPLQLLKENANVYPQQYRKITVEIDKKALKEAVINGDLEALKYAILGEKSTYLSIK